MRVASTSIGLVFSSNRGRTAACFLAGCIAMTTGGIGAAQEQLPPPQVVAPVPPSAAAPVPVYAAPPPVVAAVPVATWGRLETAPDFQAAAFETAVQRIGMIYQGIAPKEDGRSDWYMPLEQGRCYLFSGVGDATVRKLFFFLWNSSDSRVETIKPRGALVTARHCPATSGNYHVQLKVAEGRGAYALGVYLVPSAQQTSNPDLDRLSDARVAAAVADAQRFGPPLQMPGPGARRGNWSLNLAPGPCYWFVGVGDSRVDDSKLILTGPDGRRAAETPNDSPTPALSHCPSMSGTYSLEARVGGDGLYRVGVYVKMPPPPVAVAAAPPVVAVPEAPAGAQVVVINQAPQERIPTRGEQAAAILNSTANLVGALKAPPPQPTFSAGPGMVRRGRAPFGAACAGGNDCATGVCVNSVCTKLCSSHFDCSEGTFCKPQPQDFSLPNVCRP